MPYRRRFRRRRRRRFSRRRRVFRRRRIRNKVAVRGGGLRITRTFKKRAALPIVTGNGTGVALFGNLGTVGNVAYSYRMHPLNFSQSFEGFTDIQRWADLSEYYRLLSITLRLRIPGPSNVNTATYFQQVSQVDPLILDDHNHNTVGLITLLIGRTWNTSQFGNLTLNNLADLNRLRQHPQVRAVTMKRNKWYSFQIYPFMYKSQNIVTNASSSVVSTVPVSVIGRWFTDFGTLRDMDFFRGTHVWVLTSGNSPIIFEAELTARIAFKGIMFDEHTTMAAADLDLWQDDPQATTPDITSNWTDQEP